jgi:hypothetical protein
MTKLLVTSGCSYSSYLGDWPYLINNYYDCKIYNLALPSAGNDWIYRSIVYGVQTAIKKGIATEDIIVSAMWTHVDRKSFYITKVDTIKWDLIINELNNTEIRSKNPANFIEIDMEVGNLEYLYDKNPVQLSGAWIIGNAAKDTYPDVSSILNRKNEIDAYKSPYYTNFYTEEGSFIETLESILNLQWFCKSLGIKLINQSYIDLFYYPTYDFFTNNKKDTHVTTTYPHLSYLFELIDFSTWVDIGLHEYCKKNDLEFSDVTHPGGAAHGTYVKNVLVPKLEEMNILRRIDETSDNFGM